METSYYKSQIGILEIICENNALISLKILDKIEKAEKETAFIKDIKMQLNEYFSGRRKIFDIKINPEGTGFQKRVWNELQKIPSAVQDVLERRDEVHHLSNTLLTAEHTFMIGRGLDYPSLLEASLKLKEISYIHSEAFASGELKHGTIALITEQTPVIALLTQEKLTTKI